MTRPLRLGVFLSHAATTAELHDLVELGCEADRLGYDSVWVAEAWGTDALTPLAWIAARTERIGLGSAVLQIPARTPTAAAAAVATLDSLSGGRLTLGLGVSGPQVVEGWHGQAWGKPLTKTREYIAVVEACLRRELVEHEGTHYRIPYDGPDATGLGRPLKPIFKPLRDRVPIFLAALGPKNVALAAEIADGWLPFFLAPERFQEVFGDAVDEGRARAETEKPFVVAPIVPLVLGDDVAACRDALRARFALYIGGMGAPGRNFYNALAQRMGYVDEARDVQELFLSGQRDEAAAAVPDRLIDEVTLVGPLERVRERLDAWRASGVADLLLLETRSADDLRAVASLEG